VKRRRNAEADDGEALEPVAKGLVRAWLAAKLLPIAIRVATWLAWLGAALAYVGFVAWKVRRLAKRGALDATDPGDPPTPVSAKDQGVAKWIRGDEPLQLPRDPTDATT